MSNSQPAVQLTNVGVTRGGRWILDGVTASFPRGACVAVLGPNGCGKSTLMRVITGYMWPTRGDVTVLAGKFGEVDLAALRRSIRLVQSTGMIEPSADTTAMQIVLTGFFGTAGLYDDTTDEMRDRATTELARVEMSALSDHTFSTLSAGERMRCLIARALVVRPRLLLLDEPTAGLDLVGREQVLATIDALRADDSQLTIILTTHHLEELPISTTQVLLLSQGKPIAFDEPKKVLTDGVLSSAYGCNVTVTVHNGRYFATAKIGAI